MLLILIGGPSTYTHVVHAQPLHLHTALNIPCYQNEHHITLTGCNVHGLCADDCLSVTLYYVHFHIFCQFKHWPFIWCYTCTGNIFSPDIWYSFDIISGQNGSLLETGHSWMLYLVKKSQLHLASILDFLHPVCKSDMVIDTVRLHWTVFYHSRESLSGLTQTNISNVKEPVAQFVRM